ncbi:MAG TPA: suppressor of fused domain protein [Pirellulaceae bacterium]|nr:suppressor of fused domain protein [Pirellulaceae bacterium]
MADEQRELDQRWWDARLAALEGVLGKADEIMGHSPVPFIMGAECGGAADILYFRKHIPGVISVTCELIGGDDTGVGAQVQNIMGEFELMICERETAEWGGRAIGRLAYYTFEHRLNPFDNMEIYRAVPKNSTIYGFLFFDYARFEVLGNRAGLLLCVGITEDELNACRTGRRQEVENALKAANVYPYTDLFRSSVLA